MMIKKTRKIGFQQQISVRQAEAEMNRCGEAVKRLGDWDRNEAIDLGYKRACDRWVEAKFEELNLIG